jgi:Xaa-Pro aminopeptidase
MFQTFEDSASPEQGPPRLKALRAALREAGLDGFLVPRADAHQGEYVSDHDARLTWLTGFTGSAGWCVALLERAAVFVDGRYTVQARAQVAEAFEKVDWPETALSDWIGAALPAGRIGFDPWLLTVEQHRALVEKCPKVTFTACDNMIDRVWSDQPAPPAAPVLVHPLALAGEGHEAKIARLAQALDTEAALITLPDSIAWLLNIRGADIPRNPVPHGFALLHRNGRVTLYMAEAKLADLGDHLGAAVACRPPEALVADLRGFEGRLQLDPATCPVVLAEALTQAPLEAPDPCLLPKAIKNAAELEGARAAHLRDGAAMVRFLAWLDAQPPGSLTEIDVVTRLEAERRASNALRDIAFETIAGAGPHGAIVHYRVSEKTNRRVEAGTLLLVDSGGQYGDGTTDITRTIAIGAPGAEERAAFTRVLQGMIALSRLRFPRGLAGRDIDAVARAPLWQAGLDYGHGTGHGVGAYLSVHEGPARIARTGHVPLEAGMILSNEPGFYREGAFGIRIENLVAVEAAPEQPGQTVASLLGFETLTWVPIDTRLVEAERLTPAERDWLNGYHAEVLARIGPQVDAETGRWLARACQPV